MIWLKYNEKKIKYYWTKIKKSFFFKYRNKKKELSFERLLFTVKQEKKINYQSK